jgi:uncharacterized protein YhfF
MDDDQRNATYRTPLGEPDSAALQEFWSRYLDASGADPATPIPQPWCFGDTVELADELIALVIDGPKRATAGSVADHEAEGEPIPVVGDRSIVMDGTMRPRAVLETTDVRVGPLSSVDDRFAWDEGEGDRTRGYWLDAHTWFFGRAYERLGLRFHSDIPVVFERFALRYHED